MLDKNNVDRACDKFHNHFQHLPVKKKKIKLDHNRYKPWINHGILNSVYEKSRLYTKFKKTKTLECKQKYINYKNKLTSLTRNAETLKGNIRDTWKLMNDRGYSW